jgi:hypothetical protein
LESTKTFLDPIIKIDEARGEIRILSTEGSRAFITDASGMTTQSECNFRFEQREIIRFQMIDSKTLLLTKDGEDIVLNRMSEVNEENSEEIYGKWHAAIETEKSSKEFEYEMIKNFPKMLFTLRCKSFY